MSTRRTPHVESDGNAAVKQNPAPAPANDALSDVLACIRDDAKRNPETYARDAEVPFGGE